MDMTEQYPTVLSRNYKDWNSLCVLVCVHEYSLQVYMFTSILSDSFSSASSESMLLTQNIDAWDHHKHLFVYLFIFYWAFHLQLKVLHFVYKTVTVFEHWTS